MKGHILSFLNLKAWRTTEELDIYRDGTVASEEANIADVTGGHGETRVQAVWRKLRKQITLGLTK